MKYEMRLKINKTKWRFNCCICASLWCLLKQKHFNFLKQSLPSCVSSTSLALWGQVSFCQDSGTWAEGLFGERAQLIDFLSSPCCCCGKLLWILENSCWGSFVPQVYEKKRTQQQAVSKKKPGLQILQKCNFTSSSMPAPVHFAATMAACFSLI